MRDLFASSISRSTRLYSVEKRGNDSLILNPLQHLPAIIPSHVAISGNHRLGLTQTFRAERVVPRQAPQLVEQVVAVDVVDPRVLHRRSGIGRVEGGEDAFNAAELGERVDVVGAQGVDKAVFVGLDRAEEVSDMRGIRERYIPDSDEALCVRLSYAG